MYLSFDFLSIRKTYQVAAIECKFSHSSGNSVSYLLTSVGMAGSSKGNFKNMVFQFLFQVVFPKLIKMKNTPSPPSPDGELLCYLFSSTLLGGSFAGSMRYLFCQI